MSISTQIERLQNIKNAIRTALIAKGIPAETHNMEDFADDIDSISTSTGDGGTDVSDTTAERSHVLVGKFFHLATGERAQGTMPNNGAVSQTINPSGSYTIPEGYHDGTGTVTANPNQNSSTYDAKTRSASIDMGANNNVRYLKTTNVPNSNSGTYTATSKDSALDMGSENTYRYVDTSGIPNVNTETYVATSRNDSLDMGADNNYKYVDTTGVPNVNSDTYTFPVGSKGTKYDMGSANTNRYVDATNVYTKGSADGQASAISALPFITPTESGMTIEKGSAYKASDDGLAITTPTVLTPTASGELFIANKIYKTGAIGYAISSYSNIVPSEDGARFESGFNRMSSGGYAYSEKPAGVKQGSGTVATENAHYTVNTGLNAINGFVLFSDGASYDGLVAYIPNMLGSDNYAFSSIYATNNSGGMQPIGTDGTARTHTIMAVNGGRVTMKTRGANTLGSYRWVAW